MDRAMTGSHLADPGRFFVKVLADQHYQRGVQYEQQGEWEGALAAYRKASALDITNPLYLLARGRLCQLHGLEPEAEECYRLALQLRPNDTVALYNQAQLFAARGQLDEARANLARIIAGDVASLGERAAPIFCRLGDIALRRQDYAAAAIHFRRALEYAPDHRYATAALQGLERFAEFAAPFAPDGRIAPKIAVYGYAAAVALGLPSDDGIAIPLYPGLGFESLAELAQTLARFVDLARRCRWQFDAVAALDAESQPLAVALAAALGARPALALEMVPWGALALGVTATGTEPGALAERVAALQGRCRRVLYYAVGLRHEIWEYRPLVQVVSVPVRLEFPWNRGEASAPEHAEAYGAELAEILTRTPPDGTTDAQLAWYAVHSRLTVELAGAAVAPSGKSS
jgi:tetratricopeptide (TPR) repeat protein